jgi:hypothetical protein
MTPPHPSSLYLRTEKCHEATDPATKAKCEFMRAHQNFTFGMLVEEINPVKDAALYCMGGHFCRAADLRLDTGDSIETELAELGEMFNDIISSRPVADIVSFGAQNCSSCVDSSDKAVMQDVIAKVFRDVFLSFVSLVQEIIRFNRSRISAHTQKILRHRRYFHLN